MNNQRISVRKIKEMTEEELHEVLKEENLYTEKAIKRVRKKLEELTSKVN